MNNKIYDNSLLLIIFISATLLSSCGKEMSSHDRIAQAETLVASKSYKGAVIQLKKALQTEPKNQDARLLLGKIYILLGDGPSAEKELKRAGDAGTSKSGMLLLLGEAFLLQKKYDQALDVLQISSVETDVEKSALLSLRGNVYFQQAEFKLARQAYTGAITLNKNNHEAYIGIARMALKDGAYDKVEKYLNLALDISPEEKKVWLVKGQMYRQLGKLVKAEQSFEKVLANNKIVTGLEYKATISLINVQILQGKLDDAARNIGELSKILPRHPYPKYLRAWLAYQRNDYTQANTLLLELQKKIPNHMPSLLLLGASNYALGNYEQANVFLTRFVNRMPTHIQARKLLGAVRLMQNQPQKAMDVLRPAIGGDNEDAGLLAMAGMAAASLGGNETELHYLKKAVKLEPGNISLRAELARAYMRRGEFDDAISTLKPLQKEKNEKLDTTLLVTYAYIRSGKYKEARKTVKETIENLGKKPVLYTLLGVIDLFSGKREAAKNNFNTALKLDENFVLAHLNLARMELEDGNLSRAAKIYDQILLNNEKSVAAMVGLAQIAEQRGEGEKVILWLERAREADAQTLVPRIILAKYYLRIKKPDVALKIAEEIYAVAQNKLGSFLLLGRAQIFSGKVEQAIATFEKMIEQYPENPLGFVELANARFIVGQQKKGRVALVRALEIDPSLISARIGLIRLALHQGNFELALNEVKQIQQRQKKLNIGFVLAGDIYIQQHKYKEAISAYKQALNMESSAELTLKLSQAYTASGKPKKSLRILLLAIKKYPADVNLRSALGAYYQTSGNTQVAEKYYKQVLKQQPENLMALNNLAILFSEKDSVRAIKYAQLAYQQAPANAAIGDTLGWLLVMNGDVEKGLAILERVAAQNQNPVIQYHYAVGLEKAGRESEAADILRQVLSAPNEFAEWELARSLLRQLE